MEKNELITKANKAIAEEFEIDLEDITPEANIKDTLELDSLSLVDLVALIESEFGVKIKNTEITKIKVFNDLYDYIYSRL